MDNRFISMPDILTQRATEQPDKEAYIFLNDRGDEVDVLTYSELFTQSISLSKRLSCDFSPGDRALLLFEPGLDFIVAFFACLYANIVAVPVNPPRRKRLQESTRSIITDCEPSLVLTTKTINAGLSEIFGLSFEDIQIIVVDRKFGVGSEATEYSFNGEELAFLQYTSGSTSNPKGVMVSHRNLVANQTMIKMAFGHDERSNFVGWVPHYHDQGLIGNILQPLFIGATSVLMAPMTFLRNPLIWLYAISKYKAHTSGGPNFAYEACINKADKAASLGLNLQEWKIAFNGAEPVRYETMHRFSELFGPYGFSPDTFYPCYGLAEASLLVSGGHKGKGISLFVASPSELGRGRVIRDDNGRALVSSGCQLFKEVICIVEPNTNRVCKPGEIGEVWVAGDHVAMGYWRNPDATQLSFNAKIDCHPNLSFLRTGDLAALVSDELYIVGRLKDIIIIRGRNYYPHDLEYTASTSHIALDPSACAAFSVQGPDQERLVIVSEVKREMRSKYPVSDIKAAIRESILREHHVAVYDIVLTLPGRIQKTSSGKIRRSFMRSLYLEDNIALINETSSNLNTTSKEAIV